MTAHEWCWRYGHRFYALSMLTTGPQIIRCEWCRLTFDRSKPLVERRYR